MEITRFELGPLGTNCYVVKNSVGEALVFDPGGNGPELAAYLQKENIHPLAVVLTHGHSDHIGGVQALIDAFDIPLFINEKDVSMLSSGKTNLSSLIGYGVTVESDNIKYVTDGETLPFSDFPFMVITTPGHTPGGTCYYDSEGILIAGDTLFRDSIGRTDFPGGSHEELLNSIRTKLYILPDETQVLPGHGPATTIGYEKRYNPFTV